MPTKKSAPRAGEPRTGTLKIKDAAGVVENIGAPRSGESNAALHRVGASYGVIKLLSDRPHWSNDGR